MAVVMSFILGLNWQAREEFDNTLWRQKVSFEICWNKPIISNHRNQSQRVFAARGTNV